MKIVIIGGTGHIGTYLAPRLVRLGHEVVSVSRGEQKPYTSSGEWDSIEQVRLDRAAEEKAGSFGSKIREIRADVVVDLICFTPGSARHLVDALDGHVQQFLHCGTLWVYGPSEAVPTEESASRRPFGGYGVQKADIERFLLDRARRGGFPAVVLHPGHIVGPGWA
ncbi:MAG: NAD-dependent epimerase/dehydratase family protein, partial [Chloroflexi bacterium]|nr:NAD-dependent epimerase/dehydratase family protein [Chloroflexota bacterium]